MRTVQLRLKMSHVDAERSVALSHWLFCQKFSSKISYFLLICSVFFPNDARCCFTIHHGPCDAILIYFVQNNFIHSFVFLFLSPTVVDKSAKKDTSRTPSIFKEVNHTVKENVKFAKKSQCRRKQRQKDGGRQKHTNVVQSSRAEKKIKTESNSPGL